LDSRNCLLLLLLKNMRSQELTIATRSPAAGLHPDASSPGAPSELHPRGPFPSLETHCSAMPVETRADHLCPSCTKFRTLPSSPPLVST
jgi:hypothetical protein